MATAGALVGVSARTVQRAVEAGAIEQRTLPRRMPSVSRTSAEQWGRKRQRRLAREAAKRAGRRPPMTPPDDDHVWVTAVEVANRLGITASRVRQLARVERLPMQQRGRRWWMRTDHLEQVASARAWR